MKAFRFAMQHVLDARVMQEEQSRVSLAESERSLLAEEQRGEALLERLRQASCCLGGDKRLVTGRDVAERSRYRLSLEAQYRQHLQSCEEMRAVVERNRTELQARARARKAMETLREQAKAEWMTMIKRYDQQVMDEVARRNAERKRHEEHDHKAA